MNSQGLLALEGAFVVDFEGLCIALNFYKHRKNVYYRYSNCKVLFMHTYCISTHRFDEWGESYLTLLWVPCIQKTGKSTCRKGEAWISKDLADEARLLRPRTCRISAG